MTVNIAWLEEGPKHQADCRADGQGKVHMVNAGLRELQPDARQKPSWSSNRLYDLSGKRKRFGRYLF